MHESFRYCVVIEVLRYVWGKPKQEFRCVIYSSLRVVSVMRTTPPIGCRRLKRTMMMPRASNSHRHS